MITGTATTTRAIAARKLGCVPSAVIIVKVEGNVWFFAAAVSP